jgi:accessory gene regulator protein AgrB
MRCFGIGLLVGLAGYVSFTGLSYVLIGVFSSNRHDRSVEATMTSFLVWGPIGFILCFIAGYNWAKRSL